MSWDTALPLLQTVALHTVELGTIHRIVTTRENTNIGMADITEIETDSNSAKTKSAKVKPAIIQTYANTAAVITKAPSKTKKVDRQTLSPYVPHRQRAFVNSTEANVTINEEVTPSSIIDRLCEIWEQMQSINSDLTINTNARTLMNTIEDFTNDQVYLQYQFKLVKPNT